jgi:phage I-like protein
VADARSFIALATAEIGQDNRQWIEVMPTATEVHNGPFRFTITEQDLEAYAESIRQRPNRVPVDYDHEGMRNGGSTKAAGWFTGEARVEPRDSGPVLLAEVQWTPSGAQAVRDGDYRMISPEFTFHDRDRKSGVMSRAKEIVAATLTNRPFWKTLARSPLSLPFWGFRRTRLGRRS